MTLHEQVEQLLSTRAAALTGLLSDVELHVELATRVQPAASRIVAVLAGDDEQAVAETVRDLVLLAHGDADVPDTWWQTPLGKVAARSVEADDSEAVTPRTAARMLGISEPRVYQLRDSGKLDRHPDGGVTRASVLARIAELA